jgi:hypothetical protein
MTFSKISQKSFAQTMLNMKQANFSTLLSQPLSWPELNQINKQRYLIMYMWINDPYRVQRLQHMQNKYLGVNSSHSFTLDTPKKRKRSILTNEQTASLTKFFLKDPYPSSDALDSLSIQLGLNRRKIGIWFTHQRRKNKSFSK